MSRWRRWGPAAFVLTTLILGVSGAAWFDVPGETPHRVNVVESATTPNDEPPANLLLAGPNPDCPGDINDDGQRDLTDLGILLIDFGCESPPAVECVGDIDGDGDTDLTDLGLLLISFGVACCPGDANGDNTVDLTDLTIVLANYGCTSNCTEGDLNGDGVVDLSDLGIVLTNQGLVCTSDDGAVDLDIDSDNTNGTNDPDRSAVEDDAEADPTVPGKFLLVNDDDDDRNGTPDKDQAGANADEQDDLVPMILEIAPPNPGTTTVNYRLDYDPAKVRVWRSAFRGDLGADNIPPQQDEQYDVAGGPIRLWLEGLAPGTIDDVQVAALADGNGDGAFAASDIVYATVVALSASPTSGPIGTEVTWTLNPAIPPVAFDAGTIAQWIGRYEPLVDPPSNSFSVSYSASQVHVSAATQSVLVVGDGTFANAPDPSTFITGGTLIGDLSLEFGSVVIKRAFDYPVPLVTAKWYAIRMAEEPNAAPDGPPFLDSAPLDSVPIYEVPTVSGTSPKYLNSAYEYHTACVLLVDENATTAAGAPSTILVDVITRDLGGTELDRVTSVTLSLDTSDGDPTVLTYVTDLAKPIVFVDTPIDKLQFPDLLILTCGEQGCTVFVVKSQP